MDLLLDLFGTIFFILWQIIKATWWFVVPVILLIKIKPLWDKIRADRDREEVSWVLLEVDLPPDVLKTPKAMENVFAGLHGAWAEDESPLFSFELVGRAGFLHFYIRCQSDLRHFVESKVFSEYPDSTIREVQDYMEDLPPNVPSKDYDIWGSEFVLSREWAYPIKTYYDFEDIEEERRQDPLSHLGELVTKLENEEYMGIQLVVLPVLSEVAGNAEATISKLAGRGAPAPKRNIIEHIGLFITDLFNAIAGREISGGAAGGDAGEKEKPQQHLTPGEHKALESVEQKANKVGFLTTVRVAYIARHELMRKEYIPGVTGFLREFSGFNSFQPEPKSLPKPKYPFFEDKQIYIKKRKLFNAYKERALGGLSEPYLLNTEELATVYHFPGRVVRAPGIARMRSRVSEPPSDLPT